MNVSGDWLQAESIGDVRDADVHAGVRESQRRADVERAQVYRAAFSSPAGRKLLEMWDAEIANLRVSVNASLSEYVAAETVRNFVRKVHDQIRLADTEGRQ